MGHGKGHALSNLFYYHFFSQYIILLIFLSTFYKLKKNSKNFEHLKRGLLKSNSKIEYNVNTILIQKDITLWPFVLNTLKSLPFVKEVKVISISTLKGMVVVRFIGNKKTFFQAAKEKKMIFKDFNSQQYILNSKF